MVKTMKYDEFRELLIGYIEEPKTVKDAFLSNISRPQDVEETLFYVNVEQDGTIKADVNYANGQCQDSYTIKIDQELRKYDMFAEKITKFVGLTDVRNYEKMKFQLEHTNNAWNNQEGFVINSEEKISNFVRDDGVSSGKIVDYIWRSKRFFDENGIEMCNNATQVVYPDREQQYKFTFGFPEINFRTPTGYFSTSTYRNGINTAVKYITNSNANNVTTEKKTEYYMLDYSNGRLPFLKSGILITEDKCKKYQDEYSNCDINDLDASLLALVEEPMRTGLLEKYGIIDSNNKTRG